MTKTNNMSWKEIGEEIVEKINYYKFLGDNFKPNKFIEWWVKREKIGYLFDWRLYARSYHIEMDELNKDNDHQTIIVGPEGSGKSTIAAQIGAVTTPKMTDKNILFKTEDYAELLIEYIDYCLKCGNTLKLSVVMDEGALNLYSRDAMKKDNKEVTKMFMIQRLLNLHSIICIPSFKNLDTYSKEHRVRTLIYVFPKPNRGKYKCIVGRGIEIAADAVAKGVKVQNVKMPVKYFWYGYFRKMWPKTINTKDYKRKKLENFKDFLVEYKESKKKGPKWVDVKKMANLIDVTRPTIINRIKEGKIIGKKIMGRYKVHRGEIEKFSK